MTREEAIKWLNYHINITDYEETDELYIALKMAIEALSAEKSDDCISREELDKALRNFIRNFPSINPQESKLDTLDEIRAEIMDWETDIYENEYNAEIHDFVFERIYEIIDEHKAESEE